MAPRDAKKGGAEPEGEPEEEDTPVIKELKVIDDKYLELERQYERELAKLEARYTEMQRPLLEERATVLAAGESTEPTGTPAVPEFWAKALANHPAFEDMIKEWDMPVLAFIKDITKEYLDPEETYKGFKLTFHLQENPYVENETLWKEYHTEEDSPYTGDINVAEVKSETIRWKAGKDVTVEMVKKKPKGGGAKKGKQVKEKQEARASFFRCFFRNLTAEMELPADAGLWLDEADADMDEDQIVEYLMDQDHDMGIAIRDNIIPFAVRWYTGEAAPEEDLDEDEEEEEDSQEEDEEEDPSDEDESPKGKKASAKSRAKGNGEKKPKGAGKKGDEGAEKKEECKQQ